jgi:hypothetical protein
MDEDRLRLAALSIIEAMKARIETEGPDYAIETFEGHASSLAYTTKYLTDAISNKEPYVSEGYRRVGPATAKLVIMASHMEPSEFREFMNYAWYGTRDRPPLPIDALDAMTNLIRGLMDDHSFVLRRTDDGPRIGLDGNGSWLPLMDFADLEMAVEERIGMDTIEMEIETTPLPPAPSPGLTP